jgi:hypothetical protein
VKQRIATMLGFKGFATAAITIAGIELVHRIRKGQFGLGRLAVQGCMVHRHHFMDGLGRGLDGQRFALPTTPQLQQKNCSIDRIEGS